MIVYISPYRRRYVKIDRILNWFLSMFGVGCTKREAIRSALFGVDDDRLVRELNVKVHAFDLENLKGTLAAIIHPSIVKLKESNRPAPNTDISDFPEISDEQARWEAILDCMIEAFFIETMLDTGKDIAYNTDHERKVDKGLFLFAKYYKDLHLTDV